MSQALQSISYHKILLLGEEIDTSHFISNVNLNHFSVSPGSIGTLLCFPVKGIANIDITNKIANLRTTPRWLR